MNTDDAKRIEEIRERASQCTKGYSARGVFICERHIPWLLDQLAAARAEIARLRTVVNAITIASSAAEGNPQQPATPESGEK